MENKDLWAHLSNYIYIKIQRMCGIYFTFVFTKLIIILYTCTIQRYLKKNNFFFSIFCQYLVSFILHTLGARLVIFLAINTRAFYIVLGRECTLALVIRQVYLRYVNHEPRRRSPAAHTAAAVLCCVSVNRFWLFAGVGKGVKSDLRVD